MRLFAQAFSLPKAGSTEDEYEDAFCPKRLPADQEEAYSEFRVAIGDGATETSFSGLWAKMLVRSFAKGDLLAGKFELTLRQLQQRWHTVVNRRSLTWYAEEKARRGAAAAFLGLRLLDGDSGSEGGRWEAIALGDCCLVQLRTGQVIKRFPIESASEFSNSPFLLSSNPSVAEGWQERLRNASGWWFAEDCFYLMTDALAAWFMTEDEAGRAPWHSLRDLGTADSPAFADWVGGLRSARRIRNDDVTLVRLDIVT